MWTMSQAMRECRIASCWGRRASRSLWNMVWNDTYVIGDFIWRAIDCHGESSLGSNGMDTPDLLGCAQG